MIITRLMGGLGNQMFQYATAKRLAIKLRTQLKLDLSCLNDHTDQPDFTPRNFELNIFNISYETASFNEITKFTQITGLKKYYNILLSKSHRHYKYDEQQLTFDPTVLTLSKNTYLIGYFQSEKYFGDIERIIREEFKFEYTLQGENLEIATEIKKSNSVSLHIRRGDYVTNNKTNLVHGICPIEYYNKSINYILSKVSNAIFLIFSDDPQWVKNNFNPNVTHIYVDHNSLINNHEDLRLMSFCKHNIIANSSFSWWGAWLNNNPEKIVIAPKKWFNDNNLNAQTGDLIPEKWIRI